MDSDSENDDEYTIDDFVRSRYKPGVTFPDKLAEAYEAKALLGRGSFSEVIRVEHRATQHPYAVKIVEKVQTEVGTRSTNRRVPLGYPMLRKQPH